MWNSFQLFWQRVPCTSLRRFLLASTDGSTRCLESMSGRAAAMEARCQDESWVEFRESSEDL